MRRLIRAKTIMTAITPRPMSSAPSLDLGEVVDDVEEPVLVRASRGRQAEEVGQLVDDDDHGDAREEAGGDRRGEELGDPAQPQDADEHHDQPDHHGQDAHQLDVTRRAQGGEGR